MQKVNSKDIFFHEIDRTDLDYIQKRHGKVLAFIPGTVDQKTGTINPQVTTAWMGGNVFNSVFHVKPVYYETVVGTWRPLYEVTKHHGNKNIVFTFDGFKKVHPRYVNWLIKRCTLLGGQVSVESIVISPFMQYVHDLVTIPKIGLTTTTVYPDPHPETTTCDGQALREAVNATWADIHDGAGTVAYPSGEGHAVYIEAGSTSNRYNGICRSFTLFNTASIPDTDTIDSATLTYYSIVKNSQSWGTKANVYATTPASNTDIVAADYQQVTTTPLSTDITYASWATGSVPGAANDFALNSSGLALISKTGVTKLGFREVVYDVGNTAPTWASGGFERLHAQTAESAGGNDPRLVVVHSAGSSPVNSGFLVFM